MALDHPRTKVNAISDDTGTGTDGTITDKAWMDGFVDDLDKVVFPVAAKTAGDSPYAAQETDGLILCDSSGGNITITLPTAVGKTGMFLVVKKTAAANSVTIDPDGSETIEGQATYSLGDDDEFVAIASDGANWLVWGQSGPEQGPGSGLDADTVDGEHASAFADASHTHVEADITDLTADAQIVGTSGVLGTGGLTKFRSLFDGGQTVTESNHHVESPIACTIDRLRVRMPSAPGAGESITVTLRKNGSDTALNVTISGASETADQDLVNSVSFAAGDRMAWKIVGSGGAPTDVAIAISARVVSTE